MKTIRNIAAFSIFISLYTVINVYIGMHLLIWIRQWLPTISIGGFWSAYMVVSFGYIFAYMPWMKKINLVKRLLKIVGAYYMVVLQFSLLLLPIVDIIYVALMYFSMDVTSYIKFTGFVVVIVLLAIFALGSRNAWKTVIRRYPLAIAKSVDGIQKLKIVVVSDIHLGDIVGKRHLQRMIDRINMSNPDLVLMVGDILDDRIEPFIREQMDQQMRQLSATYGVFAVLGNHEYYGGAVDTFVELMDRVGIRVLRDEIVEVAGCCLVGRKDKTAEKMDVNGRRTLDSLVSEIGHAKPIIVMDHQPFHLDKAAEAGIDLLLCGHTHRGQFAPNHLVTGRMYELDWGHKRKGQTDVIVTSGYGTWGPPIRLASRSEIVELDITFE